MSLNDDQIKFLAERFKREDIAIVINGKTADEIDALLYKAQKTETTIDVRRQPSLPALLDAVSQGGLVALLGWPNLPVFERTVDRGDRKLLAKWLEILPKVIGIDGADIQAMTDEINAVDQQVVVTETDPLIHALIAKQPLIDTGKKDAEGNEIFETLGIPNVIEVDDIARALKA